MIALSVAKLKMFSPESEICLWIRPKKKKNNFFVESLGQRRRLEVREKARNVFCDDPTSVWSHWSVTQHRNLIKFSFDFAGIFSLSSLVFRTSKFLEFKEFNKTIIPFAPVGYLTVILRGRAGYELIYITNEAVGRVGYYQLISGKSEKNNCFSKFSRNFLDFFGWDLLKSWHFLYRRRREKNFSDLQNFSTRNSPSVFPYLVKLNDNGSYHGLREPIRKLENHYPELKIY